MKNTAQSVCVYVCVQWKSLSKDRARRQVASWDCMAWNNLNSLECVCHPCRSMTKH